MYHQIIWHSCFYLCCRFSRSLCFELVDILLLCLTRLSIGKSFYTYRVLFLIKKSKIFTNASPITESNSILLWSAKPLSDDHRKQLRRSKVKLMKQMNPGPVMAALEDMDVLTMNDVDGIKLNAIETEQVDRLINCLLKKSDNNSEFPIFYLGKSKKHYCIIVYLLN